MLQEADGFSDFAYTAGDYEQGIVHLLQDIEKNFRSGLEFCFFCLIGYGRKKYLYLDIDEFFEFGDSRPALFESFHEVLFQIDEES